MKNKILIFVIGSFCINVSCKKDDENISKKENFQIDHKLESIANYDEKIINKGENLNKAGADNSKIKLPDGSKSIEKSEKVKKTRKKLLLGITPLSDQNLP